MGLGTNCEPAQLLRANDLRNSSFPFDWIVTIDTDGMVALLDDDFQYFLDRRFLFQLSPYKHSFTVNSYYQLEFRHDGVILESEASWQSVYAKYERRINRFRQIRDFPGKVFFIRMAHDYKDGGTWWQNEMVGITALEARKLKEALDRYFPALDFTLVILNSEEEVWPSMEGIVEFKIDRTHVPSDFAAILIALRISV